MWSDFYKNISLNLSDKKSTKRKLTKYHIKFLIMGLFTSLIGMALLVMFYLTGFYILHPGIYLILIAIGIGWTTTAVITIITYKKE